MVDEVYVLLLEEQLYYGATQGHWVRTVCHVSFCHKEHFGDQACVTSAFVPGCTPVGVVALDCRQTGMWKVRD